MKGEHKLFKFNELCSKVLEILELQDTRITLYILITQCCFDRGRKLKK